MISILLSLLDEFEVQCYLHSILSIACLAVWSDYVKICYENEESNFIWWLNGKQKHIALYDLVWGKRIS